MEKATKYNMKNTVYSFKKKIGLFGSMWKNIR